ncbi:hypothetical protein Y032_1205g3753, partial [Ancylostoma ceylanicum]
NPATNVIGNKFDLQTLGQVNTQGQASVQQGGDQTNVGSNANAVNVGQGAFGNYGGYKPSYDAPSYGAVLIPINPATGGYAGAGAGGYIKDNRFDIQNLGQVSNQGQSNVQQGGDQTNVGSNANTVNVGQQNNQGGAGAGYGYKPSYDAPSYGGSGYAGGPIYVPDFNNFIKNNVYSQNLGQTNTQGQQNVQKGGDQTNVGVNQNQVNVGQENNQGGAGSGYKPSYDAPRYGGDNGQYNPFNFIGNNLFQQNLGQTNTQGQQSAQIGGAQTNFGQNQNAVNVGQTNNQGGQGGNYGKPSYDTPTYAAILIPHGNVIGNKIDTQTLGQLNNQGQVSVQKGGDQTNVGSNTNAVNVGQVNNQGTTGTGPSYDSPKRGKGLFGNLLGNTISEQNLGQDNTQGQASTQQGGAQGNFGGNFNEINVSQTNTQSVDGVKLSDSTGGYRKRS